jgi:hypothetical protein
MAARRAVLVKTGWIADIGAISLLSPRRPCRPLVLNAFVRGAMFQFLYVRPSWARLKDAAARTPRSNRAAVANAAVSVESTNPLP